MWCEKHIPCVHSAPLPSGAILVKCAKCGLLGKILIPSLADREGLRGRYDEGGVYKGSATIIWARGLDPQSLIRPACVFCGVYLPDDRLLCDACVSKKDDLIEELRWA